MEASSEIEELENKAISLKNETRILVDEQKKLKTVLKAAYEQITMELRKKNEALRQENSRMQAKIDEVQGRGQKPSEPATVVGVAVNENCEQIEVAQETAPSSTAESDTTDKVSDEEKNKRRWLF